MHHLIEKDIYTVKKGAILALNGHKIKPRSKYRTYTYELLDDETRMNVMHYFKLKNWLRNQL